MIRRLRDKIRVPDQLSSSVGGISQLGSIPRFTFKYEGKPIGLKTSGNYGDLPIPCPRYFSITEGPIDAWALSMKGLTVFVVACTFFGPLLLLPFWSKHKGYLKDAAEQHGSTRYGKGTTDIL